MKTTVFLVRHGEIDNPNKILYGRSINLDLNETGKKQIENLAKKLKKIDKIPQRIYSSPLRRAVKSSEILIKNLGIKSEPKIERDLIDINIPYLAGKPFSEREKIHKSGTDEYSEKYVELGNESRASVINRMNKVFKDIVFKNRGKVVAIVSHGDPIQFLFYSLTHPGKNVPSMNILSKRSYPEKGSAIELILDKNLKVIDNKRI